MSKAHAVVIAATLSVLGPAAQTHAGHSEPWWMVPSVRVEMSLTSEQVARLDSIYRTSLPQRRRLRRQLTILEARLKRQLATGPFDDRSVLPLIERVSTLKEQRNSARTLMLVGLYRVLTPPQRLQLADLYKRLSTKSASPAPAVAAQVQ